MKIRWLIPVAAATATLASGCGNSSTPSTSASATTETSAGAKKVITEDNVPEMTVDEVEAAIAKPGSIHVFDVNPRDVYDEGHVPGAKWTPKNVKADILPEDKAAKLVFYCANEH